MIDKIFVKKYDASIENERFHKGFICYLENKGKAKKTINGYSMDIEHWLEYLKLDNMRVTDVYEDEMEDYLFYCWENGLAVPTIKRKFSCIKTFYFYLLENGWVEDNPILYMQKSKQRIFETGYRLLTENEILRINTLINFRSIQYRAIINLLMSSGIKSHLLSRLKWNQVDFDNRCIMNIEERPDKIICVFFDDITLRLLKELKKEREEQEITSEYIFIHHKGLHGGIILNLKYNNVRQYVAKIGELLKIENLVPNDIRRTYANLLLNNGLSKEEISILLNYKCDKASLIYSDFDINEILIKKDVIYKNIINKEVRTWN